jgi:hypothetical protein
VVPRRSDEREASAASRLDRRPGREQGRFRRRRTRGRVEVEPGVLANCKNGVYMYSRVTPKHFLDARGAALLPVGKFLQQERQALGNLGVVSGRMQARERRMREDVQR